MKKLLLLPFFLLFFCCISFGQVWFEDFDGSNSTNPITLNEDCNDGEDYWGIVCLSGESCGNTINANYTYIGTSGSFLGACDTDSAPCDGPPNGQVGDANFAFWTEINTGSCASPSVIYVCFDIAEDDKEDVQPGQSEHSWDKDLYVTFSADMGNTGNYTAIGSFASQFDGAGTTDFSAPQLDSDCNGVGDGNVGGNVEITDEFATFCFTLPGYAADVNLRIDTHGLNRDDEDVAIDNIGLYCESDPSNLPGPVYNDCCGSIDNKWASGGGLTFSDPPCDDGDCSTTDSYNSTTCECENEATGPGEPPTDNCWDDYVFNESSCTWENQGTEPVEPIAEDCWDDYVFIESSCSWVNQGIEPVEPIAEDCWDDYVFIESSCSWVNQGLEPVEPIADNCWDDYVFIESSCSWVNQGIEPEEPIADNCWDDYQLISSSCTWVNQGSQDPIPPAVNCWDDYLFIESSCSWVNQGIEPEEPIAEDCWDDYQLISSSCTWVNQGSQDPIPPAVNCWDDYLFIESSCSWVNQGSQDPIPPAVNCWDDYLFIEGSCSWENQGSQDPIPPVVNCWDDYLFISNSCSWENQGSQDPIPPTNNCWDDYLFIESSCSWENQGSQDPIPPADNCWDDYLFIDSSCSWENQGTEPEEPTANNCWDDYLFIESSCSWENQGAEPTCDDDCEFTLDSYNEENCECENILTIPDCDDGICSNGIETWNEDSCECVSGTPPTPCVDDGDCTNGFEIWNLNTCECDITPPVNGCTNPTAINYNAAATCDDGTCIFECPDPGTCDDGVCENGLETWDGDLCECIGGEAPVDPGCSDGDCTNGIEIWDGCDCIAGTPPTPCVDDGDCTNGFEIWNLNTCECDITPPVNGCTNPTAVNYNADATCDDGTCEFECPDPGTCDDGVCENGVETWDDDLCECIGGEAPVDPGCSDGDCTNGIETWDGCDCVAGTPPTPCVDDGDCTNGFEIWNLNTCECDITPPVNGCINPTAVNYNADATCDDGTCEFECPDPGTCDDGICENGLETWDGDLCECISGEAPVDPGCSDGDCTNGIETWDGCDCIAGTPPTPCVDDGDCTNGFEIWNLNTCECDITPPVNGCTNPTAVNYNADATCDDGTCVFECPDPGTCDDGVCENGIETWDGELCECISGEAPVDPGCSDGDCTNGIETWDGCDCVAGTPPTPCVDDGDCTNGFEIWNLNTCECDITPPVNGCTNPTAVNYNADATCDDGTCEFECPDPGTCDDGVCENGIEIWDGDLCECIGGEAPVDPGCSDGDCTNGIETWDGCDCVAGTPPTPCVDDGDCTNGFEIWNLNTCECDITPPVNGCTNPTAINYNADATCDDGTCEFECPDPGTCDDGVCENGLETWDGDLCECISGEAPVDPGCSDGDCTNGIETWDGCDCIAGTPPTPCVDDGDCTNGFEIWNLNTCECDITAPVNGCTNPTADNYNPAATCDDGTCEFECPDPGTCDDGVCEDGIETWDGELCECISGEAPVDPGCSDGDCTNGIETWDGCDCVAGTPPTPCVDDGDCTNGFEIWNLNTCECDITPPVNGCTNPTAANYNADATCDDGTCEFECSDPGTCDDGVCENGIETWDGDLCECISGEAPVDPGCSDGDCTNGIETWDGCDCIAGTPPTPCVDDGDCTNGFEIWNLNTCECDITPPINGCTDPAATNYNAAATCDDGTCEFECFDPGTCDDGLCENGIETWDFNICECISGTPPVQCTDDGDCTNGTEVWDENTCECLQIDIPNPTTCIDDGDCTNGIETYNTNTCQCEALPTDCDNAPTTAFPCDDNDACTINDVEMISDCDGTVCIPCIGEPIDDSSLFAENDAYEVIFGQALIEDVTTNDESSEFDNLTVQVLASPQNGTLNLNLDGTFTYEATNLMATTDEFSYEICVEDCPEICATATVTLNITIDELIIPDAISPNGDGLNETWIIPGLLERETRKMIIINRWGSVLFSRESYENDWNGDNKDGKPLPEGTYYYYLEMGADYGTREGPITIVR